MTTRWWAPTNPSVEVDDDTLAMLRPGQDPEKDLGLYLLAAHRAGAGALTHMAKSSIGSETSLVTALGAVRPGLSEAMVDAIAPITGEVYAALLVRDVLDEADQGALHTYRTAVSKGVAPPMALERAAAGYVVPSREMGAFAALAADPKANPRAVEDAADRSLMTYVAKVAAQEAIGTVSKAEQPQRAATLADTDFDEAEHPRGPDGRFVEAPAEAEARPMSALDRIRQRLGLTSTEPSRVADTTKTPTLTPSPAADPVVQARQARALRARRAQRAAAATRTKPAAAAPAKAKPARAKPQRAKPRISKTRLNRLASSLNERFVGQREVEMPEGMRVLPDLLRRLPDPGGAYYDIGQPVVIGTGMLEAAALRTQASSQAMTQKDPTRRVFRIGHLVNEAKYVDQQGTEQTKSHDLHAEAVHRDSPVEFAHPVVKPVMHHELTGDEREDKIELGKRLDKMAERDLEMPSGDMRPVIDSNERGHMQALPVYEPIHVPVYDDEGHELHDHEEAMALIHWQPTDPAHPEDRPMPVVEEYVILTDARGREEGSGRNVDIHLDPNQVYEVVRGPHADPRARIDAEQSFDLDNQVVVNRWYLRPVHDDEIGDIIKALTGVEAQTFERLHPRDATGQFTETVTEAPATTDADVVAARQARTRRAQRVQRTAARVTVAPTQLKPQRAKPERAVQRAKPQRDMEKHPLVQALERRHLQARTPDIPMLTDVRNYKVLSEQQLQRLLGSLSEREFTNLHRGAPIVLGLGERQVFGEERTLGVDQIPNVMAVGVADQVARNGAPRERLDTVRFHPRAGGKPDFEHVAERIQQAMVNYPNYDLLDVEVDRAEGEVYIYGSKVSGAYQNVIEFEPDLDFSQDLVLNFIGEYRARDLYAHKSGSGDIPDKITSLIGDLTEIGSPEDDALVPNPLVHRYRVTSAPVRRYRMDNG